MFGAFALASIIDATGNGLEVCHSRAHCSCGCQAVQDVTTSLGDCIENILKVSEQKYSFLNVEQNLCEFETNLIFIGN